MNSNPHSQPNSHSGVDRCTSIFSDRPTLWWKVVLVMFTIASLLGWGDISSSAAEPPADGLIASPEPGWPQWRGPRRDGISQEKGLLPDWPDAGPKRLWKVGGLGIGWSSPIVVDGKIYVTGDVEDDLIVFAFDLDGELLWQTKNGAAWKRSFPGARATCAFSDGRVYHMNAHGRVVCLDADSGEELWAANILERFDAKNITWALSECLLIDGPRVIVTPGGKKGMMAALDKRNGRTVWSSEPLGEDLTSHSSPILLRLDGRRILTNCSSAHAFGVDAEGGQLLWTVPLRNRFGVNTATPIYGDGCVFYVTPYTELGRLYRLRSSGQKVEAEHRWTCPLDVVTGSGVLVDGTLYAGGYKTSKWWFGVDWQSGETKHELKGITTGAAIYADRRLYVFDEAGTVALVRPGPDGMTLAGRFPLIDRRVKDAWAHPALHDGRLYLRYHDAMWCYDVKSR